MRRQNGFSVLELTVAMGMMMLVTAGVFSVLNPSQGTFAVEPEVADLQQRLRVATDSLTKDLTMAGAGAYYGEQPGSLMYYFSPLIPSRQGALNDDPPGTVKSDTITLIYVPSTTAQSRLIQAMNTAPGQNEIQIKKQVDCPQGGTQTTTCGFAQGQTILIFDGNGNYDLATVVAVVENTQTIFLKKPAGMASYPVNTPVMEAVSKTYYLKTDNVAKTYQLMAYDGTANASGDVPVVDNVVGLTFEYFGETQPPIMKKALTDPFGPWTTYGPPPPAPASPAIGNWPVGENCIFTSDGSPTPAPRLPVLGDGSTTLVKLTNNILDGSDGGPWCPHSANPNRWDADLLRIRKVGVTLRLESASSALRGPASVLFTHGGTSRDAGRLVPDQEIRFQISPRNLNLGR